MVILVNEDAPDSDGFFCLPAQTTNAESINHILHHGRGVIFLALTEERIRELGILLIPQESGSFGGHFFGVPFSLRLEGDSWSILRRTSPHDPSGGVGEHPAYRRGRAGTCATDTSA